MSFALQLRRLAFAMLAGVAIAACAVSISITAGGITPAMAQISEDAQIALEQYGEWRPHPRFGQVWVPRGVPPDWRPYQYGHWVYTDEWGWYWVSDDVEADWGWVAFHYGRWAFERAFGWFWVAGDEWAPAWVNWRYGNDYSGWAPLPPDELIDTYEVEPAYWVFVPTRFIAAPRLRTYYVPVYRRSVILRETRIVNRTFGVGGRRLAVNPGISPAFVARVSGAPVATYRVQPRVFASTQGVAGAVPIRREELRAAERRGRQPGPGGPGARPGGTGGATRLGAVSIQRTTTVIQPSAAVTAPQQLNKNEPGRLGTHPPRAAQGGAPSLAPAQQQQQAPATTPAPGTTPPPGQQRQAPAIQQPQAPSVSPSPTPPPPAAPSTTAPSTTAPAQGQQRLEERRERSGPGGPPGTPPPSQPNVVRPIPPQASPPPPPPQERRVPPPPQEQRRGPPPPPPPPPPQQQKPPPPKPPAAPAVRQPPPPPPPAAKPPPPPAPARQAPPPPAKKPPPKPGEKPEEKK